MDKLKNCKILQSLDTRLYEICVGVDSFVGNILQWANELEKIVENEFSNKSKAFTFNLPKTPSEKKIRNRMTKNTAVSNSSVANSTLHINDISNMNASISMRTRAARRVLTSKMSQLNINSKSILHVSNNDNDIKDIEENESNIPNETFVMQSSTSTRTKPVVKKKQQNIGIHESTIEVKNLCSSTALIEEGKTPLKKNKSSNLPGENLPEELSQKNFLKTPKNNSEGRQSKSIFSKTLSLSPVRPDSLSNEKEIFNSTAENTIQPSSPNVVEKTVRRKISRALSESPMQRPSKYSKIRSSNSVDKLSIIKSPRNNNNNNNNTLDLPSSTFRISRALTQSPLSEAKKIASPQDISFFRDKNEANATKRISSLKKRKNSASIILNNENSQNMDILNSTISKNDSKTNTFVCESLNKNPSPADESLAKSIFKNTLENLDEKHDLTSPTDKKKSFVASDETDHIETNCDPILRKTEKLDSTKDNLFNSLPHVHGESENELSIEVPAQKKKKKIKKEKLSKELVEETNKSIRMTRTKSKASKLSEKVVEESNENFRITRTKSKAIKEKLKDSNIEDKQQEILSDFAKKILNKVKESSHKRSQLAALVESYGTPKHRPPFNIFPSSLITSKNKYPLLLSSTKKKLKTPLATLPNSSIKKPPSTRKKCESPKEIITNSATKSKEIENEIKLKTKKKKEDEAAKKRQKVIQNKKDELRRKNELKHQLAMKQREKLEQEKYNNMIQSEKEKEERHKIILQERQMKLKEEAFKKKMLMQQKIADTVERRRQEEEARIAKLKEIEAEEQRIALEKQKEQERQEKREQERLALKKAREEYEIQVKRELEATKLKAEKVAAGNKKKLTDTLASASKMQSISKKPRFGIVVDQKEWDYKPRNENDYGLEDEHSEVESDDEKGYYTGKPTPTWATKVLKLQSPMVNTITLEMLCEYMNCHHKTLDIHKMFNMTPTKKIKRTSSAIWNTPTSFN